MTVIINGTTGVTFPNGVTMSDGTSAPVTVAQGGTGANTASGARTALGVAIGTDVLAPNGSGANLTSLNASSVSSGTLSNDRLGTVSVAKGGTGATTLTANNVLLGNGTSALQAVAPGSSGNVLTSNGTTWTSSAPSGGVTSLNGQTGAITNTDYAAIGSYLACLARSGMSKTVDVQSSPGTTLAGSGLYGCAGSGYGSGLALQDGDGSFKLYQQAGSTQQSSLGLSGTWRVLTFYRPATNLASDVGCPVLVVRVS